MKVNFLVKSYRKFPGVKWPEELECLPRNGDSFHHQGLNITFYVSGIGWSFNPETNKCGPIINLGEYSNL